MNNNFSPGNEPLKRLLKESIPEPGLPLDFKESVWRRISKIEATKQHSVHSWLDGLLVRFLMPRMAIPCLAAILIVGGISGTMTSKMTVKQQALERYISAVAPNSVR